MTAVLWAADLELIIKVVIFLVVIGFSLFNSIFSAIRKAARGAPNLPPQPPAGANPQPPVGNAQQQLQDEVQEFLRRAAQARGTTEMPPRVRPGVEPPKPPSPMYPMGKVPSQPQQPQRRRPKKPAPQPKPAPAPETPLEQRHLKSQFEDHVSSSKKFDSRVTSVEAHEQEFGSQVAGSFRRPVGSLAPVTGISDPPDPNAAAVAPSASDRTPAESIALLLSNPDSIRDAIVLNEILTRPVGRW